MVFIKQLLFVIVSIVLISSCSKKGGLYSDYWETREAGAYKFTEAKLTIYTDGVLTTDSIIEIGNSYILLATNSVDGFFNDLSFYGDWMPSFISGISGADAWNIENDEKRITFSMYNPSLASEMPIATLTIDDIGKKKQKWHSIMNIGNQYWHYTYSVERTNKP